MNETAIRADERLRHVAFIMDGNGRWAKKRGKMREFGHIEGAKRFRDVVRHCKDIGIRCVTCYTFSTENWKRPPAEVSAIMKLLGKYVEDSFHEADENDMQLHFIGDISVFPDSLRRRMEEAEAYSAKNHFILNIAVNYGGRQEIVHAAGMLAATGTPITEESLSGAMYTNHCPDPDLIIRTGGEERLSNFLLWQCAYSEFYYTDVLWPDMTDEVVDEAVRAFYSRKRRYGGV